MKTIQTILLCGVAACVAPLVNAQEVIRETVQPAGAAVVETETTSTPIVGTVTQFGDSAIAIRTGTSPSPVQYRFSKTTQWVDETGNVVTRETVRTGAPVTVYYSKAADGFVASKVVVRRTTTNVPAEPPGVAPGPDSVVTTRVQPIETVGTLTTFGDGTIALRTGEAATPIQYHYSDTTQWMDENGRVITRENIRAGVPVTVHYTKGETGLIVSKVIVRRTTTNAVVEERPVKKIERRPAPVAAGPKTVEKETTVVEKPAPAIVEKNTTTTTTTTTPKKKVKKDDDDDDDDDKD